MNSTAFENGRSKAIKSLFNNAMTPLDKMSRKDLKIYLSMLEAGPSSWNNLLKKEVANGLNIQTEITKAKVILGY